MLVKYIDSNYIIEDLQKPSWGEVEEPDFYITMASNRVKALIFPSDQGNPNDINSYTEEQQDAIKLATAIYTLWYFDTNYDFTNGSVSVNFGGVSMSESKTYNGEMVLPNVFDILKQANLIPTTETFIFNDAGLTFSNDNVNPKAFKDLQQEVERQADVNVKQDAKIVDIYDKLTRIPSDAEQEEIKRAIEAINLEQANQNVNISNNNTEIANIRDYNNTQNQWLQETYDEAVLAKTLATDNLSKINDTNTKVDTLRQDLGDLGNQVVDVHNATQTNANNITNNTNKINSTNTLLHQTIDGLKTLKPFQYVGEYQAGTSYNINQAVTIGDKLYLSKEDNNTTTPPSDKWLILNDNSTLQVDLTNYYNKQEIDAQQTAQNTKIDNNTNALNNKVDLTSRQTILGPKTFDTLQVDTSFTVNSGALFTRQATFNMAPTVPTPRQDNEATNKAYVDNINTNLGNRITTLNNEAVKINGNYNKSGRITFLSTGTPIELKPNSNDATLITGYQSSNRRLWYLGKGSSSADNVVFGTDRGNIMLQPANVIHCNNKKITNVADPQANNDVATKQYVDNAIQNIPSGGGGGGQAPNVGWVQVLNATNIAANSSWRTFNAQSLNNNTLPSNFWENDRYYELQITVKQGDFSRKWFSRFQKLNGENWILSNDIRVNNNLLNLGTAEFYFIIGTANSGTNWREARLSGVNNFQIDNINVKIRKLDNSTSGQSYDTNVYNGNWANMNNPNINLNNINLDFSKPITITIWRSNNVNADLGYQSHTILLPTATNQVVAVSSDMYYRQNTDTIEQAAKTGIMIKNKVITRIQCWDANDRVKQITIGGWRV